MAFVILEGDLEGSEELESEVRERVAERIGKFARPKRIIWTADVPKTRSGKIMRRLLRDIAEGRELGDVTTLREPGRDEGPPGASGRGEELAGCRAGAQAASARCARYPRGRRAACRRRERPLYARRDPGAGVAGAAVSTRCQPRQAAPTAAANAIAAARPKRPGGRHGRDEAIVSGLAEVIATKRPYWPAGAAVRDLVPDALGARAPARDRHQSMKRDAGDAWPPRRPPPPNSRSTVASPDPAATRRGPATNAVHEQEAHRAHLHGDGESGREPCDQRGRRIQ